MAALMLVVGSSHTAAYVPQLAPRSRMGGPAMMAKALPQELVLMGYDEEMWSRTKNKKGLLDLWKKGRVDDLRDRIQRMRDIIDAEDREALETKLLVLRSEGEMAVRRRAEMLTAYEATDAGAQCSPSQMME